VYPNRTTRVNKGGGAIFVFWLYWGKQKRARNESRGMQSDRWFEFTCGGEIPSIVSGGWVLQEVELRGKRQRMPTKRIIAKVQYKRRKDIKKGGFGMGMLREAEAGTTW